jgi:hypothetical protein
MTVKVQIECLYTNGFKHGAQSLYLAGPKQTWELVRSPPTGGQRSRTKHTRGPLNPGTRYLGSLGWSFVVNHLAVNDLSSVETLFFRLCDTSRSTVIRYALR